MKLRLVGARQGAQWVREGVRTFWRQPLAFGGLFFMFIAATAVLSLLPVVGQVVALALVPAATVGLMAATREVLERRFPMPTILVIALRKSPAETRAMLVLGGLYALAVLLIVVVVGWTGEGTLAELITREGAADVTPEAINQPELLAAARASMQQLLLASVLYVPVSILFWHAPALVHWHGVPVGKSLFFSAVGVLRNTGAYLIYGMGWMGLTALAWLVLLLIASLLRNPMLAASGMLPLSVLIATMFYASLWFTFRDCFEADEAGPSDAATPPLPPAA